MKNEKKTKTSKKFHLVSRKFSLLPLVFEDEMPSYGKFAEKQFPIRMKTRSSLNPVPIDLSLSDGSDEDPVNVEMAADHSVVFTLVKEKRKLLMP